eukprot:2983278-Rhodomonas_salina.1
MSCCLVARQGLSLFYEATPDRLYAYVVPPRVPGYPGNAIVPRDFEIGLQRSNFPEALQGERALSASLLQTTTNKSPPVRSRVSGAKRGCVSYNDVFYYTKLTNVLSKRFRSHETVV